MSTDEWLEKKFLYVHTMKYYLALKKGDPPICDNLDQPKGYYAKWDKPDTERKNAAWFPL